MHYALNVFFTSHDVGCQIVVAFCGITAPLSIETRSVRIFGRVKIWPAERPVDAFGRRVVVFLRYFAERAEFTAGKNGVEIRGVVIEVPRRHNGSEAYQKSEEVHSVGRIVGICLDNWGVSGFSSGFETYGLTYTPIEVD